MKMRTLREVYEEIGVSRTTLQGWVNNILEKPTLQDDTGWYFNDKDFEKIWQIRFFKQLKYSNSKIKEIFNNPNFNKKKCLEEQILLLNKEKDELEKLINVAYWIKETGIDPHTIRFGISEFEDVTKKDLYNDIICMIGTSFKIGGHEIDEDGFFIEEEIDVRLNAFNKIMDYCKKGVDAQSKEVQLQIGLIPEAITFAILFSPDSEIAVEIDKEYGKGKSVYFYDVLQIYQKTHDDKLITALGNIIRLASERFPASSDEVQEEVKKIYHFSNMLSDKGKLKWIRYIEKYYGSDDIINIIDNGAKRGLSWFISRAIQIYCDRLEKKL